MNAGLTTFVNLRKVHLCAPYLVAGAELMHSNYIAQNSGSVFSISRFFRHS